MNLGLLNSYISIMLFRGGGSSLNGPVSESSQKRLSAVMVNYTLGSLRKLEENG